MQCECDGHDGATCSQQATEDDGLCDFCRTAKERLT